MAKAIAVPRIPFVDICKQHEMYLTIGLGLKRKILGAYETIWRTVQEITFQQIHIFRIVQLSEWEEEIDCNYLKNKWSSTTPQRTPQRRTRKLTSRLFIKVENMNPWVLDTNHAASNMASKLRPKFFSPYVDEKLLRSLQKRVSPRRTSQELEATKGRFHNSMWLKCWRWLWIYINMPPMAYMMSPMAYI